MSRHVQPARAPTGTRSCEKRKDGGDLLDAAQVIADMAQRVQLNGSEPVYASEKLGHALFKAAEALALCGVELEDVISDVHRGYRQGRWLSEGEQP